MIISSHPTGISISSGPSKFIVEVPVFLNSLVFYPKGVEDLGEFNWLLFSKGNDTSNG